VFLEPPPQSVQEALRGDPRAKAAIKTAAGFGDTSMQGYQAYQVSAWLVGSGVLERHPTLHFVFVECGAGWLVWALDALDFAWQEVPGSERIQGMKDEGAFGDLQSVWSYPMLPSEYVHRQIHATFQDEPAAIRYRKDIGIDQLMWGSDFPHPEGTWPHSQEFVARRFASVEEPERSAILHGNFAKLYGIEVPK
jgi:predicted TIM-barrel fold metal-dependent hydrolase